MTSLSPDLEDLLEAERDIERPAVEQRERMLARLEPLLVVPAAIGAASIASSAATSSAASAQGAGHAVLGAALKAKIAAGIVSAALVGVAVGAAGYASLASPPAPRPAVVALPTTIPARAVAPAEAAPVEPVVAPPETLAASPAPSVATALPSAVAPSARPAGSLRAERLLLETASAALMRGDPKSAVSALRQHAQKFPRGELAEEREVLLVKALAASGDSAAAEKRAQDFKKKFPDSMQQGSVNDAARAP